MTAAAARFGLVPPEPARVRTLDELAPKFRDAVERVITTMHGVGQDATIAESLRTEERQAWLYRMGREYDDGRGIVTNAPDAFSGWHFFGLAVDIISASREWDASGGFWAVLGICARREGLVWGGDWKTFPDRPHLQWGEPMRRSPSSEALELFKAGGREAVWREVGAV